MQWGSQCAHASDIVVCIDCNRDLPIMLHAGVLKILTYYAQYYIYTHVKDLCLNLTVLLDLYLIIMLNVLNSTYYSSTLFC